MQRRYALSLSLASAALSLTVLAANKTAYADTAETSNLVTDSKKETGISQPYAVASSNASSIKDSKSHDAGAFSNQKNVVSSPTSVMQSNVVNDNVAHNVSGDWTWQDVGVVTPGKAIDMDITNSCHRMGMNLAFDVSADQLKAGNTISVARFDLSSNNSGRTVFLSEAMSTPVEINNQYIGRLNVAPVFDGPVERGVGSRRFSALKYSLSVERDITNLVGVQHFDINAGWLGTINYRSSWSFRGVKDSINYMHLTGDGLDKTYILHYTWPADMTTEFVDNASYSSSLNAGSFLTDDGWTNPGVWIGNPLLYHADEDQLNKYHASFGKDGDFDLNQNIQYGFRIYADQNNSVYLSSSFPIRTGLQTFCIPLYDDNGHLLRVKNRGFDTMEAAWFSSLGFDQKLLAPNLSLAEMKAENFVGVSVSTQDDGSILMYYNLPLKAIRHDPTIINEDDVYAIAGNSDYINYLAKDKDDALRLARRNLELWARGPLKGTPDNVYISLGGGITVSDPSLHPKVYIDMFNPQTGDKIWTSSETGVFSSTITKGQSLVKLHVINAENGRDLVQVKTYTDWPNQGKKANLTLSNITGYHLVDNFDTASSVLRRFNYVGTPLMSNVAVDYPAADTVNNYYYVMDANDETATINFVDQDQNNQVLSSLTLTGKFNQTINANDEFNRVLQGYLISGKYDLISNALTELPLYQDGNQTYLVVLKHHIDSVKRHYKVVENLPDGIQRTIIDVSATLYKDANVNYYSEGGAYVNGDRSERLLKANEFVVSSGTLLSGDPYHSCYLAPLTLVPGYSVSFADTGYQQGIRSGWRDSQTIFLDVFKGNTFASDLTNGGGAIDVLPNTTFHVNFVPNHYPVIVNYYDLTGKLIDSRTDNAVFNSVYELPETIVPEHYVLMSNQLKTLKVSWDVNELDLIVAPKIDYSTEVKSVNRTISIVRPDSSIQTVLQTTSFSRLKLFNEVTSEFSFGDWSGSGRLLAYVPKAMEGYRIDPVRSLTVLPTDEDINTIVRYVKLPVKQAPKYIDTMGQTYDILPVGYQIAESQNPNFGTVLIVKTQIPVIDIPTRVTRTITIVMPNGRARLIKQTVKSGSVFSPVHLPKLHGYKVLISGNINKAVANDNMNATVRFVKI